MTAIASLVASFKTVGILLAESIGPLLNGILSPCDGWIFTINWCIRSNISWCIHRYESSINVKCISRHIRAVEKLRELLLIPLKRQQGFYKFSCCLLLLS